MIQGENFGKKKFVLDMILLSHKKLRSCKRIGQLASIYFSYLQNYVYNVVGNANVTLLSIVEHEPVVINFP